MNNAVIILEIVYYFLLP